MYNDIRPQPFQLLPEGIKNLLIINGLLFFGTEVLEGYGIKLRDILGLHLPQSAAFAFYQPITHLFMHAGIGHLLFNMLTLWMFGSTLENIWGTKRFLLFFFLSGLGAAFIHYLVTYLVEIRPILDAIDGQLRTASGAEVMYLEDQRAQVLSAPNIIGASGGISGVWIAFAYLFPNSLLYLYFLFPIKAKYLAIFYVVYELYAAFSQMALNSGDNVAHFAHLGGMLFGFIAVKYIFQTNRNHFY